MDSAAHPLKALLQLQLSSDSLAVLHLPYILGTLTADHFAPSPHLQKWIARVNSLLHSKSAGGRWAGLCLAHSTAVLSKDTMIECGLSWLGVAIPMLSKKETVAVLKGSVHLCRCIFSSATDLPEFQRQVAVPNVPKFIAAMIALLEADCDAELKVLILNTMTRLIPLYPSIHRASHNVISAFTLRLLSGGAPNPTPRPILEAASRLYAVLHLTGGKVGAANLWRRSVDETLEFGWNAFIGLRTTFPLEVGSRHRQTSSSVEDPLVHVPLGIERLQSTIDILGDLLKTTTHRPVQVPIGTLTTFATALITASADEKIHGHIDSTVRAMEMSALPTIWKAGCDLLTSIAKCTGHHLTPNLSHLSFCLAYQLEQRLPSAHRLPFLSALNTVLTSCHPLHSPTISSRLVKAVLPSLTIVLASQDDAPGDLVNGAVNGVSAKRKGKKRGRGYEGDELFKGSREVIFSNKSDGEAVLAACDVLLLLQRNPTVSPALHSISTRVILNMLLTLPHMSPAALSVDPTLHSKLLRKVRVLAKEQAVGVAGMGKSLGIVLAAEAAKGSGTDDDMITDILLHPRVPPLVRSLPPIEALALFKSQESIEEAEIREAMGLVSFTQQEDLQDAMEVEDVVMTDQAAPIAAPAPQQPSIAHTPSFTPAAVPPQPQVAAPAPMQSVAQIQKSEERLAAPTSSQNIQNLAAASAAVSSKPAPSAAAAAPRASQPVEEEVDEDMPAIDLDSDSDY